MDKKSDLLKRLRDEWPGNMTDAVFTKIVNIADAVYSEPDPHKRNWLAVDEKTPEGTLCRFFDNGFTDDYISGFHTVSNSTEYPFYDVREGEWQNAELFLGIHLLDNPGLDAPPCDGLILLTENHRSWQRPEIFLGDAGDVNNWENVTGWAPVKWLDGKLVIDLDRLR